MTSSLKQIQAKVKNIAARNPVYTDISQWVGDLLSITVKASDNFRPVDLKFDSDSLPEAWYQGKSLIHAEELTLNWEQIKDLYKQLVNQIKNTKDGRKQIDGLLQAVDKDSDGTPILIKSILTSDFETIKTTAKELKIDPPVLTLLLRLSLRPALLEVAQTVQDRLDLDHWHHGHCPVCGSAPILADLSGEGGKRTLHCSLCETAWSYTRLRCPFCENDNRDELSYLKAENEEGLRVDLCNRCGNYLKTLDLRELSESIIIPLDDAATWHLDLIAQENLKDREIKRS